MLSTSISNLLFGDWYFIGFSLAKRCDNQKQVSPIFFQWCHLFKSQVKLRIQCVRKWRDDLPAYLHQPGYVGGNSNANCGLHTNRPQLSDQTDISFTSPFFLQINIDFHTKTHISQNISEPTLSCFDDAQRSVYSLMAKDSFPRFLRSEMYKELVKKQQHGNQKRWLPFLWENTWGIRNL